MPRLYLAMLAVLFLSTQASGQGGEQGVPAANAFFGAAAQTGTWLPTLAPGTVFPLVTPLMSLAPHGGVGAAAWFGARVSDAGQPTFPVENCFSYVDANPAHYTTWCAYKEADLTSTAVGRHINEENSIYSLWPTVQKSPFNLNPLGGSNNLRLDCGKGTTVAPAAQNCSTALEVLNNGARFRTGLLYATDALALQDDGTGEAIGLASLQAIKWHGAGLGPAWRIFYRGSGAAAGSQLELGDGQAAFNTPVEAASFRAALFTPASSSAPCRAGQFADDAEFHYVCVAADTWKRVALSAF